MIRGLGRVGALVLTFAVWPAAVIAITGGPAAAHGPSQPDALFYRTDLTEIVPAVAGVAARVDQRGEWIELRYTGSGELIVLGYSGEPYLRVTASSVEENMLSPATFLNQSMFADLPTGTQQVGAAPSWRLIAGTGTARWHDHRIHWMGQARPPAVAADPSHRHQVGAWAVHALKDGRLLEILGMVTWVGRPAGLLSSRTWLILAVNLPLVGAASLVWMLEARRRRRRLPDAAGVQAALVVEDRHRVTASEKAGY